MHAMFKVSDVDGNAHLLGKRPDTPPINAALDNASFASYVDTFPNVRGDAMASGIPGVVTNAGDSTSLVGDTTAA